MPCLSKRADKPFIKAPNPYEGKQGWLKNQNNLLEPISEVVTILPSALVEIIDSVEQEREQEGFIDTEKKDADVSTN